MGTSEINELKEERSLRFGKRVLFCSQCHGFVFDVADPLWRGELRSSVGGNSDSVHMVVRKPTPTGPL